MKIPNGSAWKSYLFLCMNVWCDPTEMNNAYWCLVVDLYYMHQCGHWLNYLFRLLLVYNLENSFYLKISWKVFARQISWKIVDKSFTDWGWGYVLAIWISPHYVLYILASDLKLTVDFVWNWLMPRPLTAWKHILFLH